MSDETPEPRFSKADLFGFALLIAMGGSLLGHWYADDNTRFLRDMPLIVLWHALFIGFPFYFLALMGVTSLRVWLAVGAISLAFWGAIFRFMAHFTT